VLGENNSKLNEVMKGLYKMIDDEKIPVKLNLVKAENAQSMANLIVGQLKKRTRSRQIIKSVTEKMRAKREIKGMTIRVDGLIDGSEIAQKKRFVQGQMPLSKKDSNIEVGEAEAFMSRGIIGVKVLIYKGKI
jgi:small subunit ribosomal protein S3